MLKFFPRFEELESRWAPSASKGYCPCPPPTEEPPVNQPPLCEDVVLNSDFGATVEIQLAAVDPDGDVVGWSLTDDADNGELSLSPTGFVTYTPDEGFSGSDTFEYHVNDGKAFSETCTVTINVAEGEAENAAPVCEDSLGLTTPVNTPLPGGLIGSDPDGDPITFVVDTQPASGTVVVDPATGLFVYTPNTDFVGVDSFTFHVNDGELDSEVCTVEIGVPVTEPPGVPPECEEQSICIEEDAQDTAGQLVATDADGDALTFALGTPPANGTATVNPDGTFTYIPDADYNGLDQFTAVVTDETGLTHDCVTYLSVTPVNDAPSFSVLGDQAVAVDAGAQSVPAFVFDVVFGPADEAAQTGTFTVSNDNEALFLTQPSIAPDGTLTYEGAAGATGSALVTALLKDDGGTGFGGIDTSLEVTFTINIA